MNKDLFKRISLGYVPSEPVKEKEKLDELFQYKDYLYDIHFAHYDKREIMSGRDINVSKENVLNFVEQGIEKYGFNLTLLMNNIPKGFPLDKVVEVFKEVYYPRGVRNVVIADINLIRKIRDSFPDVLIQGSCLSYRLTAEELEEERIAGVSLHNPRMEIIRDVKNLKRNSELGYRQKVLWSEGCLKYCPFEPIHREALYVGRPLEKDCKDFIKQDPFYFLSASWITVERLKELIDYIDVIKLSRGANNYKNVEYPTTKILEAFIQIYENDLEYDVLMFARNNYASYVRRCVGGVPSSLFKDGFFDLIEDCGRRCEELNCRRCNDIMEKLYTQRSDSNV